MKFSDKSFLYYLAQILGFIAVGFFYAYSNDIYNENYKYLAFFFGALSILLFLYNNRRQIKVRVSNLEEYAQQNDFEFIPNPDQDQIDEFGIFKSVKGIADKNSFLNILVPKDSRILDRNLKPKIITGMRTVQSNHSSYDYFTQIFFFEIDHELPLFYLSSRNRLTSFIPFGIATWISQRKKNGLGMMDYKKIEIDDNNFPIRRYDLYSPDLNAKNVFNKEFIELLQAGIKKNITVDIESAGDKLIFFIRNQRHTSEGLDFYTNLFKVMIAKLKNRL
jgi:hypothetical protein